MPDTTAEEALLLGHALSALNGQHDPRGALQALDRYYDRFPRGRLVREAGVARVQTLLALGDEPRALATLDQAGAGDFAGYPRPSELRLLRAELQGRHGRCREALPTFSELILEEAGGATRERALAGKASCEGSLGDRSQSERDWARYLDQFPGGASSDMARHALGE